MFNKWKKETIELEASKFERLVKRRIKKGGGRNELKGKR